MKIFLVFSMILFTCHFVSAQGKEQMEVIKDYKADIPETPRFELNASFLPADTSGRKQRYNLLLRPFEVSYITPNIKPLRMVSEENPENFPGFLSLGLGLPLNRALIGHYALSPNQQSLVSIDVEHRGMNNHKAVENQRYSQSLGIVKAEVFTKAGYTISGDFNYAQQNRYFYGYNQYNIEKNKTSTFLPADVRRQFQDFGGKISFYNHLPTVGKFDYRADLATYSFGDNLKNKENGLQAQFNLAYNLSESNVLSVGLLSDLTKYTFDTDTAQRLNQFFVTPSYSFHSDKFKINVGAKLGLNNGQAVVLPNVETDFQILADKLSLFLGVKGAIEKQNFRLLATENPFIVNNIAIKNANNTDIYAGIKGQTGGISFRIEGSHRSVDNLALYLTNRDSIPRFNVVYDTARIISFGGEVMYQLQEGINIRAAVKQRIYQLNTELKAWHLPSFTAMFGVGYTKNKIKLNLDVNSENGVPYLGSEGPLNLDPLIEVNLGGRYSITKQMEAFIQLNNLLNNKRQRWQYYENFGINFLAGLQMRF